MKETAPDFPPKFHSAIQVTIEEKGYSFVLYEAFDYDCDAVVQEYFTSKDGHVRLLFDFRQHNMWRLYAPNATHPQGSCAAEAIAAEVPFEKITGRHVANARHFLGARSDTWRYEPRTTANNKQVRCDSFSCWELYVDAPVVVFVLPLELPGVSLTCT